MWSYGMAEPIMRRRLCMVVLHSSVLLLVYSLTLVIFCGQCNVYLGVSPEMSYLAVS